MEWRERIAKQLCTLLLLRIITLVSALADSENRTNTNGHNNLRMSRRRLLHYWSIDEHYTLSKFTSAEQRKQVLETALHQSLVHSYNISYIYPDASPTQLLANLYTQSVEQQTPFPPMPPSKIESNLQLIKNMFQHAYDSYMHHGYPAPEVKPISCQPGPFQLAKIPAITLIDSLDMLLIMGNYTEFARSVERLRILDDDMKHEHRQQPNTRRRWVRDIFQKNGKRNRKWDTREQQVHPLEWKKSRKETLYNQGGIFAIDENVSVFETNIRVLGGLISAHLMAKALFNRTIDSESNQVTLGEVWDLEDGHVLFGDGSNRERKTLRRSSCQTQPVLEQDMDSLPCFQECETSKGSEKYRNLSMRLNICQSQSSFPNEFLVFNQKYPLVTHHNESNETICRDDESCYSMESSTDIHDNTSTIWTYDGLLLKLAHDMGQRLLPAFNSVTGIPYGTVNLIHGVPPGETPIASLAGAGTLTLEMQTLSRLTGDESFGKAAKRAMKELWNRRSETNIFGKHIDINNGQWTEALSGIGSNSDSFYEYMYKHYLLFPEDEEFWVMFQTVYSGIYQNNKVGEWYSDVDMNHGAASAKFFSKFESLMAFYPGLQVLLGELQPAARTTNSIFLVREQLGFLPERFSFQLWSVDSSNNGDIYPLRPELIESCYFLHSATKGLGLKSPSNNTFTTTGWLWAADFALHTIEHMTRAKCGYCAVNGVSSVKTGMIGPQLFQKKEDKRSSLDVTGLDDEMPSFFLSETLKYFYLLFDESNFLHTDQERAWIFTTEAHPLHWVEDIDVDGGVAELKQYHEFRARLIESLSQSLSRSTDIVYSQSDDPPKLFNIDHSINSDVFQLHGRILREKPSANEHDTYFLSDSLEYNAALAVHSPNGRGNGFSLKPSCSNLSHSNALWLQSLSGDSFDYNAFYSSSTIERESVLNDYQLGLVSPLSASAFYGSSLFASDFTRCKFQSEVRVILTKQHGQQNVHLEKLVLGGGLGDFVVKTFLDSFGFSVIQLSTGEEVMVHFFSDSSSLENPTLVMVDYQPNLSIYTSGVDYLHKFSLIHLSLENMEQDSFLFSTLESNRKSLVADFAGHVYVCDIVLKDEQANILSKLPCTPATFGPSDMENLIHQNEIHVEALLNLPEDSEDMYGCLDIAKEEKTYIANHENRIIQLFHRGECPFEQKGSIYRPNVEGIIVINNEADRLFLMAGSQNPNPMEGMNSTITVLISEHDGAKIKDLLRSINTKDPRISSAIRIYRHMHSSESSTDTDIWPKVECREGRVQVLTSANWGVVAMKNSNNKLPFINNAGDDKQWQIIVFPTNNGAVV